MINHFRTYKLAVEFHRSVRDVKLPDYLKDQLLRSSSSVALNLADGSGRATTKDQLRFFAMAMGSLRESQAALDLAPGNQSSLTQLADTLGAHLFRLIRAKNR
jgi:four helix bundle protein